MTQEQLLEKRYPLLTDTQRRDTDGSIMPWYTFAAQDWIKANMPLGGECLLSVLEFGGGHSTLWWRKRASEVVTIEYDSESCLILDIHPSSPLRYFYKPRRKKYDVVIVDSEAELARQEYVIRAFDLAKHFVIIDNYQQPDVCIYSAEVVEYLTANSKEVHVFNQPQHRDGTWQTAIFVK